MSEVSRFSLQGLAGLIALIAAAAIIIIPLSTSLSALADKKRILADRREAETSLTERIASNRAAMIQDKKRYARSLGNFDAVAVAATLRDACNETTQTFLENGLAANCSESSTLVGDGITSHYALLTVSGDISAILSAMDRVEPNLHVDQFVIEQPERQQIATLRLRFSDISVAAEESE